MRIINIHIADFGKLHEFRKDFNEGLNIINEPNGFGKTTIASFIKAILFGLPGNPSSDPDKNERIKYTPWEADEFGGDITVELGNGKMYLIQRYFRADNERRDSLDVIDLETGRAAEEFLPNPGEKIFGVNADNFKRCIYAPQNRIKTQADALTANIGRSLEVNSEGVGYAAAKSALEGFKYILDGVEGRIALNDRDVVSTQLDMSDANRQVNESMADLKELREILAKRKDIEKEIKTLREVKIPHAETNKSLNLYQKLKEQLADKEKQFARMTEYFNPENEAPDVKLKVELTDAIEEAQRLQREFLELKPEVIREEDLPPGEKPEKEETKPSGIARFLHSKTGAAISGIVAAMFLITAGVLTGMSAAAGPWLFIPGGLFALLVPLILYLRASEVGRKQRAQVLMANIKPPEAEDEEIPEVFDALEYEKIKEEYLEKIERIRNKALEDCKQIYRNVTNLEQLEKHLSVYEKDCSVMKALKKEIARLNELIVNLVTDELKDLTEEELSRNVGRYDELNNFKKRLNFLEKSYNELLLKEGTLNGRLQNARKRPSGKAAMTQDLRVLTARHDDFEQKLDNITLSLEMLAHAREHLFSNYVPPVKQAFFPYIDKLSRHTYTDFDIDDELNISIEESGAERSLSYFSEGIKDLAYFSLRMAIIDVMYKKERPFLILDEPFVSYDDEKLAAALALLNEISAERQIIYLTSSARVLAK